MKNIFKGARFGDKFKMRNGNPALYIHSYMSGDTLTHYLVQEQFEAFLLQCYDDGQNCMNHKECNEILFPDYVQYDIVGKWEEPIDEKKLNKFAKDFCDTTDNYLESIGHFDEYENIIYDSSDVYDAYLEGYRKAKEE